VRHEDLPRNRALGLLILKVSVVVPTFGLLAWSMATDFEEFEVAWLIWAVLIGAIELLPVPAWSGLSISVGFPLLMMVAILYPPATAGVLALLGASDAREFRREIPLLTALFNRAQVALSVTAASAVFHTLAVLEVDGSAQSPPWVLISAAALAAVADYLVNGSLVTAYMSIRMGISPWQVVRQLRIGNSRDFLVSYLGLGILGLAAAVLWTEVKWWSIPAYLAPLLFARQVFLRSQALEEAHRELQEREEILRELSNTMAEERADERLKIAGYLHDDLAQVLFRLSLQVDIARKMLEKGDLSDLVTQLDKIRESKQDTSDRIRALIRDLHRSPLGAKGLADALESFTDEVGRDSGVVFHRDVQEISLPAPIALLIYHVAREGVMNALKHAQATDMWIGVVEESDDIVLRLRDNGVGFDSSAPGPEGHYGMAMMRERAKVGGGSFEVTSSPGTGTTITARFPIALLQREQMSDSAPASASGQGRASHDMPGTRPQTDEGSRDSVPA